jgi:hypothetical protein
MLPCSSRGLRIRSGGAGDTPILKRLRCAVEPTEIQDFSPGPLDRPSSVIENGLLHPYEDPREYFRLVHYGVLQPALERFNNSGPEPSLHYVPMKSQPGPESTIC